MGRRCDTHGGERHEIASATDKQDGDRRYAETARRRRTQLQQEQHTRLYRSTERWREARYVERRIVNESRQQIVEKEYYDGCRNVSCSDASAR